MSKKYSLFIGRWQPFHEGHKALIDKVLDEGKNVCIAIRDTEVDENNPYDVADRMLQILEAFRDLSSPDGERRLIIVTIPDIEEICYGRDVGYGIRELSLGADIEAISGTKVREAQRSADNVDNG